jgi:dienelactone hydrolase
MLYEIPIVFWSNGVPLAGRFYRNTSRVDEKQPGVIVTGSWLTVKEQMPAVYAKKLADAGYTAFTFDFSGFGESQGIPKTGITFPKSVFIDPNPPWSSTSGLPMPSVS